MMAAAEGRVALTYVEGGGIADAPRHRSFESGAGLPDLGKARHESAGACSHYFVFPRGAVVNFRRIDHASGGVTIVVDQFLNPDTVEFSPGGLWRENVLLHGRVATGYRSPETDKLMNAYRWAIKRHFTRVRAFWVGPAAMELLRRGARLTAAEQCPREYDLALE